MTAAAPAFARLLLSLVLLQENHLIEALDIEMRLTESLAVVVAERRAPEPGRLRSMHGDKRIHNNSDARIYSRIGGRCHQGESDAPHRLILRQRLNEGSQCARLRDVVPELHARDRRLAIRKVVRRI